VAYHAVILSWPAPDSAPAAASPVTAPVEGLDAYERHYLRRLLLYGFLVRAALALLLELTGYSRLLAPDEETYASSGLGLALYWAGDLLLEPWRFRTQQPLGYFYINAVFFYVFGQSELPLKLTNALLGALTGRYIYFIARELFGAAVARRSALYAAFFPSLMLWSAVNIRDVWVILLILFVSWKSLQVVKGRSVTALVAVVGAVYALTFLRDYLFFVVALPPLVAFLIGGRGNLGRNFLVSLLAGLGLVVLFHQGAVSERAVSHLSLEAMSRVRQDMATGGSAFHDNVDISTPAKALAFLPLGIAYFLFSPFPWQLTSTLKLFSLPEMLLIYALAPAMLRGLRHAVRTRFREALQVLLLTALLTVSYALGEGNVGTLYRHRAQAMPFYLMFAAVGLELRRVAARAGDAPAGGGLPSPAA
jgi:4-amino-4-deoxy-L-arabinose transferase-like glycosyltransferase